MFFYKNIDKEMKIMEEVALKASEKYDESLPKDSKKMLSIVEKFIKNIKGIVYGGTAINNILPKKDQFYAANEFPDWDFFSNDAFNNAKKLADLYIQSGFENVEAKSGVHYGTYKVYVNFVSVADITQLDYFYDKIMPHCIKKDGILYAPPDWLRMSLYLELSRPKGDISRWEKLLPRLRLLNKHYPMKVDKKCNTYKNANDKKIINKVKNILINDKVIFFGNFARKMFNYYYKRCKISDYNDFDVLSLNAKKLANTIKSKIKESEIIINEEKGELIPISYSIKYNDNIICNIYQSDACYSFNKIKYNSKYVNIASIFTILSLYLVFLYTNNELYDIDKIKITSYMYQTIYNQYKSKNKGILKLYTVDCLGKQLTFEDILERKKEAFNKYKKGTIEYDKWFLRYTPSKTNKKVKSKKTKKKKVKSKKTKKK